jgi:hypothetical protein
VLSVKRNKIIDSLNNSHERIKLNSSSKSKTPVKKTPKKCDFIATTESIKQLKSNASNSSPKIELYSPKKKGQVNNLTRENRENYENCTQRHLSTNPKTVNYREVQVV